jgi:hypothetical protein
MGVVAVRAIHLSGKMLAPQKIDPLLMMLAGMACRIRPFPGF